MKHTKRLLALLLALVLALGLAMPAMAAVNWDDIIVTPPQDLFVPYGESYTLSVEVVAPAGAEVSYQWHRRVTVLGSRFNVGWSDLIPGATSPTLQLNPGDDFYAPVPGTSNDGTHVQKLYCTIVIAGGDLVNESMWSATVTMEGAAWEDQFKTIVQPQDMTVKHGESIVLSAQANKPDGVSEVTYQWYRSINKDDTGIYYQAIEGATAPTLQLHPGNFDYPEQSGSIAYNRYFQDAGHFAEWYFCVSTAVDSVTGLSKTSSSRAAYVKVRAAFGEKLYSVTLEPFVYAIQACFGLILFAGPFSFLFWPVFLVQRYFGNVRGLF